MIKFEEEYINEFKNKIVFAPNGFGKTTLSKKIKEHLDNVDPDKTLLFTRRSMDTLVTFDKNNFYFGETATLKLLNSQTQQKFSMSTVFRDFVLENYGVKSGSNLANKSLFFSLMKVKNVKTETLLTLSYPIKIDIEYGIEEAIKLDTILNNGVFSYITDEILKSKEIKIKKSKRYVTNEIYSCLEELSSYADENKLDRCPLCGKKFKNEELLRAAINKCFSKYEIIPEEDAYGQAIEIYGCIVKSLRDKNDKYIKMIFDGIELSTVTFKEKIQVLQRFSSLCSNNNSIIFRALNSLKIGNESIGDLKNSIEENNAEINHSKENLKFKERALNSIKKEFDIIAKYSDAKFQLDYNNFSLSVIGSDSKPLKVSETLSESELKRLSLVIILAKIKYSNYNCLILDDPIDSYDDYYLSIVCGYIADLLKEKKLTNGYYVFTNNYLALFNLSRLLRIDSIIFYEDPDDVFLTNATKSSKLLYLVSSYKDVDYINKSELVLLKEFLNPKKENKNTDCNLSFLAFLTTLRNLNTEVISGFTRIRVVRTRNITRQFQNNIKEYIEHCYMHYEPGIDGRKYNSKSLTIGDVANIYGNLSRITNLDFRKFKVDNSPIVASREKECRKQFTAYKNNKLLALIFKKILFVSELKFKFEKVLIDKLVSKFKFSQNHIVCIANCNNGVWSKLKMANKLNRKYGYGADDFLKEAEIIHKENSQLVNQFDHALAMMFPPYLNTRIFDIKKYKDDIDNLNDNF